ncbi:MAG: hypothetical protein LBM77_00905 [Spirochaetaceae bacterium]|jgi:hypothetical protein|nr:hypothetical protein [Spirochaetaceae bacterium]
MALIECFDCGNMLSEYAEKCPKCGMPISEINRSWSEENNHLYGNVTKKSFRKKGEEDYAKAIAEEKRLRNLIATINIYCNKQCRDRITEYDCENGYSLKHVKEDIGFPFRVTLLSKCPRVKRIFNSPNPDDEVKTILAEENVKLIQEAKEQKEKEEKLERQLQLEEEFKKQQISAWRKQGRCPYCGGEYAGFLRKRCTFCGKEKGQYELEERNRNEREIHYKSEQEDRTKLQESEADRLVSTNSQRESRGYNRLKDRVDKMVNKSMHGDQKTMEFITKLMTGGYEKTENINEGDENNEDCDNNIKNEEKLNW